jgi:hypothetical protein
MVIRDWAVVACKSKNVFRIIIICFIMHLTLRPPLLKRGGGGVN